MSKKLGKLVNPYTGEMKCKICDGIWVAKIRPNSGGKFYRGNWQCPFGCKFEPKEQNEK